MFLCHICGSKELKEEFVSEVFDINGKRVLVENIPAHICLHCGEVIFSRETTEKVRRLVHSGAKPQKTVRMDVYNYI